MEYKGYVGKVEYDEDAQIFSGMVINTRDIITFQGESVGELKKAFEDSVDDYLKWCEEDGVSPEKPYSGRLNLRLSPETHKKAAINAKKEGISLNKYIEKAIENELLEG